MVDGLLGDEEPGFHTIVHVTTLETYPVTLPSHTWVGMVAVPLSREEQEHISRLYQGLRTMGTLELALALRVIE